jgi:DNA polymerase III alpha subunit
VEKTESSIIDLQNYKLPDHGNGSGSLKTIHPPIPRNRGNVNFDIYDYEMLFNDPLTKKLIREGKTIGCFYIESPGMRSLLKRLEVEDFEMLTAASSIIRPGVAESGMMQEFIARHKDPSRRKYLVPELENVLGETYGVMIYQEDVIKVANQVAGLSLEEADLLRRAMSGKLRSHDAMKKLTERFFDSCKGRGYPEAIVKELWRQIESFAGYAFCKAHSASFALLSFQVAFLKVHYPAEFMASVLNNQGGYYLPAVYIEECRRIGLNVKLPCINYSEYEYIGNGEEIRLGFMAIKSFSHSSAQRITEERERDGHYVSLADFLVRTKIAYEETAILIRCGAMDCFNQTRPTLMRLLDVYIKRRKLTEESCGDLFLNETFRMEKEVATDINYSIEEICAIEYETFSYMVSKHPLEFFTQYVTGSPIIKSADMLKYHGRRIKMIGWYMTSKRIKTKKGDIMKFLSLEDLYGTYEAVLFPKVYNQYAELTMPMGPYLIEGRVDKENGNNIIVEKLEILTSEKIKVETLKDSAENKYYGDVEKVYDEEFSMVASSLDMEKLKYAYI